MDPRIENINKLAGSVRERIQGRQPVLGIVLGSGLGKLADMIQDPIVIPYRELPGFPVSTATGHKGNFIVGQLGGKTVIAMQGRIHYYEGYGMDKVVLPIRVMIALGIKTLIVSNAAGGTNLSFHVGDLMVIKDHINLLPNPLIGPNWDELGPRFPDMTRPYDPALIRLAFTLARKMGISLQQGVYVGGTGPSYETPAEYKYFRSIGGDAVGMSTIPEVIVARHAGVPVFGMSVITNEAHDDYADDYVNDGEDVVAAANAAADKMSRLIVKMIENMSL
ncbi:MAG: purine-nucleoside phosphorylase [Bacteroidales bacterium]|nr:purine-nucleoside phosphorylase [Bacteroidales bacterium]